MANQDQNSAAGVAGKFAGQPITVWFAAVILAALLMLALLRHLFGSVRVDIGTR